MNSLIWEGKSWSISPPPDKETVEEIKSALECSTGFASVLAKRGGFRWSNLIDPDRSSFHDPASLPDIDRAVSRVLDAVRSKERIYIHGDFDVDGLTAASVLFLGLQPLCSNGSLKVEVGVWDYERLNTYVADPTGYVPGGEMFQGIVADHQDRVNLIAYLRMLSDDPVPLP